MADSESDVSKALAAFGAPPLKYRSFSHAPIHAGPAESLQADGGPGGVPPRSPLTDTPSTEFAPAESSLPGPLPAGPDAVPPATLRAVPLTAVPPPLPPPPLRPAPLVAGAAAPLPPVVAPVVVVSPAVAAPQPPKGAYGADAVQPGAPSGDLPLAEVFRILGAGQAGAGVGAGSGIAAETRDVFRGP